ncbi:MAG: ABC transporter ATP-binding protein, partial [Actinomycetota bacterium]
FLDEPTTGFDPSARRNAWGMIQNLKNLGKTVFLTTHYMDEAQVLADRVAMIVGGKIVAEGTPAQLAQRTGADERRAFTVAAADGDRLAGLAREMGIDLREISPPGRTLEDVYLELTKEQPEERAQ